jgi:hypothetical protein
LNGTHQLLAYADDVNLLGDDIDTINKNTQTLIDANKEVGLEVNVEKTKYMLVSRDQNAGQNRLRSRKLRLTAVGVPPRRPRDTPLFTKVATKIRRQVAVAQSVYFAC